MPPPNDAADFESPSVQATKQPCGASSVTSQGGSGGGTAAEPVASTPQRVRRVGVAPCDEDHLSAPRPKPKLRRGRRFGFLATLSRVKRVPYRIEGVEERGGPSLARLRPRDTASRRHPLGGTDIERMRRNFCCESVSEPRISRQRRAESSKDLPDVRGLKPLHALSEASRKRPRWSR